MFKVRVYVSYKESVLDPQAEVIEGAMNRLNQGEVSQVKIGKFFDFNVKAETKEEAIKVAEAISDQLLANVNMESYQVELLEEN
ncbi:phosphoribosylformylglycinamidine synthase subunit PurS [Vagococcus fluvialis]|uniref:Phosphoribosylformylglycinamidine synthase subunit PurS n=1 Tax=Vagococcus fluvialis TaxID=2738 RepID=A0A369AYX4_9ENTE|nr:phosphoribosylformylglycinamidine synthase subunit PurS [Vagococcus fluvialis]MBO0443152.1 phosphoribosylformylglycinamidine synthase subunit PurS [Vagococcus fluvialis]MBO0480034.1 phosphoribosylformylglycinamidine synthase subunit PurS [Vagococcus fluvialis]MBO0483182.1 phosphoribosylformylglycinamidine synthase subunit PurS [Vagococcus fluvialis]MCM2140011.1 phosphoribosylformylglycinamidine synthase subunit PurS [Vagococcus fluvialis]MDT2747644.1 phosphoribosylformylglycinamidine syntha